MAKTKAELRMANYSQVYLDTLAEFESNTVPGDQGDAGKGQVNARAGYKINLQNPSIGYIRKNPGQTQYHGIAVDAIKDRSDGTGADYLTDELQPDGTRVIKVAYTPYPNPAPTDDWMQPTADMLNYGGPLVLTNDTGPVDPEPVPDDITVQLDRIEATLADIQSQQVADTTEILAAIGDFKSYVVGKVEQLEAWINALGKIIWLRRRPDDEG